MHFLIELFEFFDWLKPRRSDDPFTARCRRTYREAVASTASLFIVLAVGTFTAWQLGNLNATPLFAQLFATLSQWASWAFLAGLLFTAGRVLLAYWAVYRLHTHGQEFH